MREHRHTDCTWVPLPLRHGHLFHQGDTHRSLNYGKQTLLIAEFYLGFRGMDIYIDILRWKGDINHGDRVFPRHEQSPIGILCGATEKPAMHPASIDEEAKVAPA